MAYRFFEPDPVAFRSSLVLRFGSKANDTQTVVYYFKSVDCRQRTCWRIPGEYAIILRASGGALSRMLVRGFDAFRSAINGSPTTANNFGYDEFLQFCEELKVEPILVVNFRDGLLAQDGPKQAATHTAKLVAYCNAPVDHDPSAIIKTRFGRSAAIA